MHNRWTIASSYRYLIHPLPNYRRTRWLFLRLLSLIYLVAFISLWVQVDGLLGRNGILPAAELMSRVGQQVSGWERYHLLPTLFWLHPADESLHLLCGGGVLFAVLLLFGIAPGPLLILLWLFYLSLVTIGSVFLSFQWDNLLLEAGFLAILLASWHLRPKRFSEGPSRLVLWALWLLIFKLFFGSGLVKLLSGDPTWRNLTALDFHYETQPLPTPLAWYANQLPSWFQATSVVAVFAIELIVPFLIFIPCLRRWAFSPLVALQVLILLTGNYGFFNCLSIALCVLLLDDGFWGRFWPRRAIARTTQSDNVSTIETARKPVQHFVVSITAAAVILLSGAQMIGMVLPLPRAARSVLRWVAPFRTINDYGLFAVMTTSRPEIMIEGSNDGETWQPYQFRWKPGALNRPPAFVAPYQPRLDWQMWFAALSNYQNNPWLVHLMLRLLEGSPEVESLLAHNPFPEGPPRFLRTMLYEYHFTRWADHSSDWWRRDLIGPYTPVVSLKKR